MSTAPKHRRLPMGLIATLVVSSAAIGGGAVALATSADGPEAGAASHPTGSTTHTHAPATGGVSPTTTAGQEANVPAPTAQQHEHPELAPYAQREAAATTEQRDNAAELVADVRATLVAYADVDAAVAAGYRAPALRRGAQVHYRDRIAIRDGTVLDPNRPEGLVYYTRPGSGPVLLGAFFVAPPGSSAPTPAGDLFVWHSHSPACAGFFATADAPCIDTRRMLHVWTVEGTTLFARRTGRSVDVEVTDPFGAPFGASVAAAR